jgi:hypothetical protein
MLIPRAPHPGDAACGAVGDCHLHPEWWWGSCEASAAWDCRLACSAGLITAAQQKHPSPLALTAILARMPVLTDMQGGIIVVDELAGRKAGSKSRPGTAEGVTTSCTLNQPQLPVPQRCAGWLCCCCAGQSVVTRTATERETRTRQIIQQMNKLTPSLRSGPLGFAPAPGFAFDLVTDAAGGGGGKELQLISYFPCRRAHCPHLFPLHSGNKQQHTVTSPAHPAST